MAIGIGCTTAAGPLAYQEHPGFIPHSELILNTKSTVRIVTEGVGVTADNQPFYYIAYIEAREPPVNPDSRARRSVFLTRDGNWIPNYSIHIPVNQ